MNQNRMLVENILLWAVRIGLWVIPLLPFYIASSMLFPFITGKNFTFRIIIEMIVPLWAGLAIMRPEFRPRLTMLVKAVTLLVALLFLADIFGPNPYRSFFSNYERMEGFISFAHLYVYFLMLLSVFRTRRDWLIWFHVSIVASIAVSYVALLQHLGLRPSPQGGFRVDSTIGNPTYLAAYLLFHIWLFALLMKQFWPRKSLDARHGSGDIKGWILQIVYGLVLLFELVIIYFTATRGAVLALLITAIPFFALAVLYWNRMFGDERSDPSTLHRVKNSWGLGRKLAAAALGLIILVPLVFWLNRNSSFIRQSPVLSRITNYSLHETTITSRFLIWNMSWKGALERPFLGWGQENYYLVFQKYYDPGLYAQEPWFDRSHDIIFDWLVHAGFIGLAAYLSVFGAVFWMIAAAIRRRGLALWEGSVLVALFVSYFFQNIFVFDNLNTYLLFFAFLAYTQYLALEHTPSTSSGQALAARISKSENRQSASSDMLFSRGIAVMIALCAVSGVMIYVWSIQPIYQSRALIDALRIAQTQTPVDKLIDQFKLALSYDSFGNTEVREQIGNAARTIVGNPQVNPENQKKFAEFAISELKKEISIPNPDIKHMLFLASIFDRGLQLNPEYAGQSEKLLLDTLKLAPNKQIAYFELAQLYVTTNHADRAIEALRKAWQLDTAFTQAGINLEIIGIVTGHKKVIPEVQAKIDHGTLDEQSIYRLGLAYQQIQDYASALPYYEQLVRIRPDVAQYHATYAALLGYFHRVDEAEAQVREASRLDPNYAKEADQFIKSLRSQPKK
ncbi:MAG: O-antigen ligase family protein [Candidatus Sungbacteria bacterium]|nr:O-antigen ligase family protein [Candidatus Sungbacteria bacterium]